MDIQDVREKFARDQYEISFHAEIEWYFEGITVLDLEKVISNCEILEEYPNVPRGSSLLIPGYSKGHPIHKAAREPQLKGLLPGALTKSS